MIHMLRRVLNDESGSEVVEFALSIWIWIGVFFLLVYMAFAIYVKHFVGEAAHEGARYAMVRGSTWNGASCSNASTMECTATTKDVTNFVESRLPPGIDPDNLTVTTRWPGLTPAGASCDDYYGSDSPNCIVNVEVDYSMAFPFASATAFKLSNTAKMTVSQ